MLEIHRFVKADILSCPEAKAIVQYFEGMDQETFTLSIPFGKKLLPTMAKRGITSTKGKHPVVVAFTVTVAEELEYGGADSIDSLGSQGFNKRQYTVVIHITAFVSLPQLPELGCQSPSDNPNFLSKSYLDIGQYVYPENLSKTERLSIVQFCPLSNFVQGIGALCVQRISMALRCILGSSSPIRAQLMSEMMIDFVIKAADIDEKRIVVSENSDRSRSDPAELTLAIARAKSSSIVDDLIRNGEVKFNPWGFNDP